MKNLSKNDKLILVGLVFLGVLFLYYQFLLNPMLNKISDTALSIEQNTTLADDISVMEKKNRTMDKEIEQLKVEYEKFKQSLPVELRDPDIQINLNLEALNSNVQVKSISFGEGAQVSLEANAANKTTKATNSEKGALMLVPVTINLQGDDLSIMKYVSTLEKSERISEVRSINLTRSGGGVNVGVVLNYFYIAGDDKDKEELDYKVNVPVGNKESLFK